MSTFTLFFHGTSEDRYSNKNNEIIHDLSELMSGSEGSDYLILDGPGTIDKTILQKDNNIYDVTEINGQNSKKKYSENSFFTVAKNLFNSASTGGKRSKALLLASPVLIPLGAGALNISKSLRGEIYGEGMDSNINYAMNIINKKFGSNLTGHTINMIGWSRGAVSCIRCANHIQAYFGSDVKINIFAIDPVAGNDLGTESEDTYFIPEIVKNFVAIIVEDDKRGGFLPQDINRLVFGRDYTKFVLLPMPGSHDTPCRATKNPNFSEVPHITRYLAYHFLNDNGTKFLGKDIYSTFSVSQLCEMYASIKLKRVSYRDLGKSGFRKALAGGLTIRDISSEADKYISHDPDFFVNEHHVECFKKSNAGMYTLFFKPSVSAPPIPTRPVPPPIPARPVPPPIPAHLAPAIPQRRNAITSMPSSVAQIQISTFIGMSPNSYRLLGNLGAFYSDGLTPKSGHLAKPNNGAMSSGLTLIQSLIK